MTADAYPFPNRPPWMRFGIAVALVSVVYLKIGRAHV